MKRVVVHIDRLVLKGFRHEDRHAIAEGLREELNRLLLAEPNAAAHFVSRGSLPRLKVGGVRIETESKPVTVGAQLARGIARETGR
ncbi:hypothetical protein [Methylocaldum sp. GT1BB]|jgi:hypothetical protein|uniref:hypothetical protein n=1 Tax=Methylocaldum sp. GT1BB TaxID=3438963 RepID=UPI003DA04777